MKHRALWAVLLAIFICQGCSSPSPPQNTDIHSETPVKAEPSSAPALADERKERFAVSEEGALTFWDYSTAFELCSQALVDLYQANRGNGEFPPDLYMENKNLIAYMEERVLWESDYRTKNNLNDEIEVTIGLDCAEFRADQGVFYLRLVSKLVSDYGGVTVEPTEFLVQAVDGRLVIADWYCSDPSGYDVSKRGENQIIDDITVWDET